MTSTLLTRAELKTFPSERLIDDDSGGGLPTGIALTGVDNELFDPVAQVDRVNGDMSLKLVYAGVASNDDAKLYGSYFAITEPADDTAVSHIAIKANRFAESRADIVKKIEDDRVLIDSAYNTVTKNKSGDVTVITYRDDTETDINAGDIIYLRAEYIETTLQNTKARAEYGEYARVDSVTPFEYNVKRMENGLEVNDIALGYEMTLSAPIENTYTYEYLLTRGFTTVEEDSFIYQVFKTKLKHDYKCYGVKALSQDATKNSNRISVASLTDKIAPCVNNQVIETAGINHIVIPQNGDVQIFNKDTILISNTQSIEIGTAHTAGQTVQMPLNDLSRICLKDANNTPINAQMWDYDLVVGSITWSDNLDLSAYVMPITAKYTQEELNRIIDIQIDADTSETQLILQFALERDYLASETYASSVVLGGDLQAQHTVPFTQRSWAGEWADEATGDALLNTLNLTNYPMQLINNGTITERWLIKFISSSQFEFYGEAVGYVGTFDILTDFAPSNPATNTPYLTISKEAFGGGQGQAVTWSSQDVIRFNTIGALLPIWILRAVQPNRNTQIDSDGFKMSLFGD